VTNLLCPLRKVADANHLERLLQGVAVWNAWRAKEPSLIPNLGGASLVMANLSEAKLGGANLQNAKFGETVLGAVNLSTVAGLERCGHFRPSYVDFRTLQMSGLLPLAFLRGVGLPDSLID
jgi:uncharacterized protein YjbI with pentapeptide repeats